MRTVAKNILDIKAVFLSPDKPFTWASGIISPIYCDNRLILSYPAIRKDIETKLAELIKKEFTFDILMGTATAGIPHAAYVSDCLSCPMGYVRSSAKDHGRNNKIEGHYNKGDKVVVVEDLISTGKSSIEVVDALRDAGLAVVGVASIFTYGLSIAQNAFLEKGVKTVSLVDYDTLVEVALENNYIEEKSLEKLAKWKKDPTDKSWMD